MKIRPCKDHIVLCHVGSERKMLDLESEVPGSILTGGNANDNIVNFIGFAKIPNRIGHFLLSYCVSFQGCLENNGGGGGG